MAFDANKIDDVISGNEFSSLRQYVNRPDIVNRQPVSIANKKFEIRILFSNEYASCYFENCHFEKGLEFDIPPGTSDGNVTRVFDFDIHLKECRIDNLLNMSECIFEKKVMIHDCEVHKVSEKLMSEYPEENFGCLFTNTKFQGLADFWKTTFQPATTFYKTDFRSTAVFSMVTFEKNVLFTYALFAGKAIFARTKFNQGVDLSQAIISGTLQPFDLKFKYNKFIAEYVANDDYKYQDCIDNRHIIPLVNKVRTFQVLKKAFEDTGNYYDSIVMNREEKLALRLLTQKRYKDKVKSVNYGDKIIMWLNRWSNHYRSDFRNGIWFTIGVTIIFGFLTLVFTEEFQRHFCWGCDFDENYFIKGVKFLFNFLNPARRLTYLNNFDLKFYGIAYVFDFFGRMAVGYGIYQTVQAFRKFK
jgi:hypothetical protein